MAEAAAKLLSTTALTNPLADGIYVDLPEEIYRPDPALGSTDHSKLLVDPPRYWWNSPLNPNRPPDKETPATIRGRAMHVRVLEGEDAFGTRYIRVNHTEDMTPAEKSAATKAANAMAEKSGKIALPAETFDRITIASATIAEDPELATAFVGGFPEISIFWTRDGIRRKSRLDYLKPRGIGDLKSIANTQEIAFEAACLNNFARYHYEVQAALYLEARSMIPKLMSDGVTMAHGALPLDFLRKCAETKIYAFQFVFFQSEDAPIVWSTILSPGNPILEIARREIDLATDNFKRFMDHFGPNKRWCSLKKPEELDINDLPAWAMRNG